MPELWCNIPLWKYDSCSASIVKSIQSWVSVGIILVICLPLIISPTFKLIASVQVLLNQIKWFSAALSGISSSLNLISIPGPFFLYTSVIFSNPEGVSILGWNTFFVFLTDY